MSDKIPWEATANRKQAGSGYRSMSKTKKKNIKLSTLPEGIAVCATLFPKELVLSFGQSESPTESEIAHTKGGCWRIGLVSQSFFLPLHEEDDLVGGLGCHLCCFEGRTRYSYFGKVDCIENLDLCQNNRSAEMTFQYLACVIYRLYFKLNIGGIAR